MKKASASVLLFAIVFFLFITIGSAESPDLKRAIVTFEKGDQEAVLERTENMIVEVFENISAASILASEEVIQELRFAPYITQVEEDVLIESNLQMMDWAIPYISTPLSWETGYTGKGVKIGVIDSGIAQHPDLKIAGGVSVVDYTSSYNDDSGHGTHVAGIIGAVDNTIGIKGIASGAQLYAIKVFDGNDQAYLSDVIKGIDWAITKDLDILNLSLGTKKDSPAFREIIRKAYAQDIVIVAAAGNNGLIDLTGDTVEYPARYDEVIAVAAVDQYSYRARFSAAGPAVDIAAPGVGIYSTHLKSSYLRMSGTSMATPYVVGQAALIKEAYPALNNDQIRKLLMKDTIDLGAPGKDPIFGQGLLQAASYTLPAFGVTASLNPPESLQPEKESITGTVGTAENGIVLLGLENGQKVDVSSEADWTSGNVKIATAESGRISFVGEGETVLTATYKGFTAKINVTVTKGTAANAITFKDVSSTYWAYDEINEMMLRNVITGYPDQTFQPWAPIKRQHVALMFSKVIPMEEEIAFIPFSDVPDSHQYFTVIKTVQQAGIFSGHDQKFSPQGDLTRAQMAKVLVAAFDLKAEGAHPFPDVSSEHWAGEEIGILYNTGVTTGSFGKFKPQSKVTRAEFAVFMSRAFKWQETNGE